MKLGMPFIPLRVKSEYSIGESAVRLAQLARTCKNMRIPAIGLADNNNMFGALEFAIACAKNGIQPLNGCDISVRYEDKIAKILLFAKNDAGYKELIDISSTMYTREVPRKSNDIFIDFDFLEQRCSNLIALCGAEESLLHLFLMHDENDKALSILNRLKARGCDIFIELQRYEDGRHKIIEPSLIKIAYEQNLPLVATNHVRFIDREMHEACDALSCIVNGTYFSAENRVRIDAEHYMKGADEMKALFRDIPEAIENTVLIAKKCTLLLQPSKPKLPKFEREVDEIDMLESYTKLGLERRLQHIVDPELLDKYWARLEFEFSVIAKMKYAGYFLIVSDFIKWSKANNIPVGPGRGSGAGSIVAWALEITEVDPIKFGLLFERFLNPDRVSMPDFDIDFCQTRRDEVIKYVAERYGRDNVAHIITFGKLQARAVLRDVGRVLQISYGLVDSICKMVPNNPANPVTLQEAIDMDERLREMKEEDADVERMLKIALELEGIVRHSSIHPAGVIISDGCIKDSVPLYVAPDSDIVALQFSMKLAELAGLIKFDFLGLKTLTVIQQALFVILHEYEEDIDINKIALSDKAVYEMLSEGKTSGVFQFEGAGIKEAMKKLKPTEINDLIALSSLYRPGPMGNIKNYINRKHGSERIEYIHADLKQVLSETYGIIVYQEQVMEIFKILGKYSLAEADIVRRAMGKKDKAEMHSQRQTFVERAVKNGLDAKNAEEIFDVVDKFAGYGFNKSHATAYGIISYQTAYIKAHYPHAFFVASINLEIDDSEKIALFCMDAKQEFDIEILSPCINKSGAYFAIERRDGQRFIRFGLAGIKNVSTKIIIAVVEEREKGGEFSSLKDFVYRCKRFGLNKRTMENLIKARAFFGISSNFAEAMSEVERLLSDAEIEGVGVSVRQITLQSFIGVADEKLCVQPWSFSERLTAEYEALGFYLTEHPTDPYCEILERLGVIKSSELFAAISDGISSRLRIVGVVMSVRIRSGASGRYAFVKICDEFGISDFSIFNEALLLSSRGVLIEGNAVFVDISAKVDDNGVRVIAESIDDLHKFMQKVGLRFRLFISNKNDVKIVSDAISKNRSDDVVTFPVKISARLARGVVNFKYANVAGALSAAKRRHNLSIDDMYKLRQECGIEITESVNA